MPTFIDIVWVIKVIFQFWLDNNFNRTQESVTISVYYLDCALKIEQTHFLYRSQCSK